MKAGCPICPDFLLRFVALIHSMRLSLMKGAHSDLSSTAWQEIGVKPGFGLSGIHGTQRAIFCHWEQSACQRQVEKEITLQNCDGYEARRAGHQNFSPARKGWGLIPKMT
jgi:hypothetical protein